MTGIEQHSPFYNFLMSPDYRIWRHLFLIIGLFLIAANYSVPEDNLDKMYTPLFGMYILALFFSYLLTVYLNIYVLIPKFLIRKKYFTYIALLLSVIVFLLIIQFLMDYIFPYLIGVTAIPMYHPETPLRLVVEMCSALTVNLLAFIGCSITVLLKHWLLGNQSVHQMERENLEAEVAHLKEQVSPDFLFSTMRSIGQMENQNTESASVALMKLCRLLRYQLYDGNREQAFLISEIRYLTDYLELHQLNNPKLTFHISSDGDIQRTLVPPMIFISFVQQGLLYIKDNEKSSHIDLSFTVNDDNVCFECKNDKMDHSYSPDWSKVNQRLTFLFGDDYSLECSDAVRNEYKTILNFSL